ncbi:MAG: hypothetical protein AAF358_23375 [Pseudomonadota bacterium]
MKFLIPLTLAMSASSLQAQTLLRVGDEPSCDFNSINDAHQAVPVNAADGEFHILVNQDLLVTEPVLLNRSVEVTGGYTSCGGSPTSTTEIDGDQLSQGLSGISTGVGNNNVVIRLNNFVLRNLRAATGSGILMVNGNTAVTSRLVLDNVSLLDNGFDDTVSRGGAIAMNGAGGKELVLKSIQISGNRASRGGGIACDTGTIEFQSGQISGNDAIYFSGNPAVENPESGLGGGMYLENCSLTTRNDPDQSDERRVIRDNRALRMLSDFPSAKEFDALSLLGGGGLYLVDSTMTTGRSQPLFVEDNAALVQISDHKDPGAGKNSHVGGGIFLNRSQATIAGMKMTGNRAVRGAGIYARDDSHLTLNGAISSSMACGQDPAEQEACILIAENQSIGDYDVEFEVVAFQFCTHEPGHGGGIYSIDSTLRIDKVLFRDNEASYDQDTCPLGFDVHDYDPRGAAISASDSDVLITNSVFYRHFGYGANSVFHASMSKADHQFALINSTAAEFTSTGNKGDDFGFFSGFIRRNSTDYRFRIDGSLMLDSNFTLPLISNDFQDYMASSPTENSLVRCSVLDDPDDLVSLSLVTDVEDLIDRGQTLIDPDNGDFGLATSGEAAGIDACGYELLTSDTTIDGTFRQRPQDAPGIDNGGPVDVGAVEAPGDSIAFFDVVPELTLLAPNTDGDPLVESVDSGTTVEMEITLRNDGLSPAPIGTGYRYIMRGVDPNSVEIDTSIYFGCSQTPYADYAVEISCNVLFGVILPQDRLLPMQVRAEADGAADTTFPYLQSVSVTFQGDTVDAVTNNNLVAGTLLVTGNNPVADIAVELTDNVDPVQPDGLVTYTVTVTNNGPSNASDVMLGTSLPLDSTFISEASVGFDCSAAGTRVDCQLGILANGDSRSVDINVQAPDTDTQMTMIATASAAEIDPQSINNTAAETTEVVSPVDTLFSSGFE